MKIAFFDTHTYDKNAFDSANEAFNHKITYFDFKLNERTVLICKGFDAVCVFVNDSLNTFVLQVLQDFGIKLVVLRCAGYNNVDLNAAQQLGITVVRVPQYSPQAVSEHACALLLALTRKIPQAYVRTKSANFSLEGLEGRTLYGLQAGLIGTGKIGRSMAKNLLGFGMKVCCYDVIPDYKWAQNIGVTYVDLKELFTKSDVISLHCPLTEKTKHIINSNSLSLVKKDAVIINTSRGALIDTQSLIEALKKKKIGGAGLDVYEEEKRYFFSDWSGDVISDEKLIRLMTFPNVLITSHQGFLTQQALAEISYTSLQNAYNFEKKRTIENLVMGIN